MKNNYLDLFEIIKKGALKKETLGDIYNRQVQINSTSINNFFENMMNEVDLSRYDKFNCYKKYINLLGEKFKDCFEFTGGKSYRFFHSQNVAFLANQIAEIMNLNEYDRNIVVLSGLFHDIGKSIDCFKNVDSDGFCGIERKLNIKHEEISANMAKEVLELDFDLDICEKVVSAILDESCESLYSKILFDADNMAELGEIGIFRMFYYTVCDGQSIEKMIDFWHNHGHNKKIQKVDKSQFDVSKILITNRLNFMSDFILDFSKEVQIIR